MTKLRRGAGTGLLAKNAWRLPTKMPDLVKEHESRGRYILLKDGTNIFVRDQQHSNHDKDATVIVMVHGVPASSFLYRKLFEPLLLMPKEGDGSGAYRVIAMDLPGLGLSGKPLDRDYSWPAMADALAEIMEHDALGLFSKMDDPGSNNQKKRTCNNKIHLVFHDIGGPIATLYAAKHARQHNIVSMTAMDTLLDVANFTPPFPMFFFPMPLIGKIAISTFTPFVFRHFMYLRGVQDMDRCDHDEAVAWVWLLKHKRGAKSFAKIMKSFPKGKSKQVLTQQIQQGLGQSNDGNEKTTTTTTNIPMQIIWAQDEVAIPYSQCQYLQHKFLVQPQDVHKVPGRHFYQLESATVMAVKMHQFLCRQALSSSR